MNMCHIDNCLSITTTAQTLLTLPGDVIRIQEPIPPYGMLSVTIMLMDYI